jgi:hypothetical protein
MLTSEKRVKNFSHALGKGPGSAVAFCLAVIVVWPVGALLAYHVRVSVFFSVDRYEKLTELGLASVSQCDNDRTGMAPFTLNQLAVDASWLSNPHHSTLRPRV